MDLGFVVVRICHLNCACVVPIEMKDLKHEEVRVLTFKE